MEKRVSFQTWMAYLLGAVFMFVFTACSKNGEDTVIDADNGKFVEVPDPDTWVKDDDIKSDDLDLLVDLSVKAERMRQEFVLMLSNGGEGNKLFCGVGPKTDVGPTIKLFTDMMLKQDEYKAALERLDETSILKPTSTRGWIKDGWQILTTGQTEAEAEKDKVQDVLNKNNVYSNENAQKQLYDFYCAQEPDYAKKIGAKNAKDFFNKLNNGELNSYMLNISHIWRDKGILEADKNSAVGDYAYTAFTGKAEYANSAYRVSSKIAVAAGDIYFSAIDKVAGGYGAKIMELSDALEKKITKIKLMRKVLEGKPDWQDINTYIVKSLSDDIKAAISDALGDDDNIGTELVNMVTEEILDWVTEQCTAEGGDGSEEAKEKQDKEAKAADLAVLNIETDFSSQGKMILVTDESTHQVNVATPTYDGHVSIATTPGNKIITVFKNNGERLTRRVTVVAGTNTVIIKSEQKPYIDLNPSSFTLEGNAGSETAVILTNCKYIKLRQTTKEDWCDVQLEINGSAGRGFHVRVVAKANLDKDRSGSFILEGYEEAKEGSSPVVTKTFKFTQYVYTPELTPIDVNPTSLTFDGNGGEKILTLNTKDYKYYGGFCDEASDEWLTVVINDNKTLTIKAKANDTGAERYGTVYAYGSDVSDPKTLDQVGFKAIPITQTAGNGGGAEAVSDFFKCSVQFDIASPITYTYYDDGQTTTDSRNFSDSYWIPYDTKEELENSKGIKDLHISSYDVNTKKDGKYLIYNMDINYDFLFQQTYRWYKKTCIGSVQVKILRENFSDINTYKVVSCSWNMTDREEETETPTYNINEITKEYQIDAEIPLYQNNSGYEYRFKLKGKDVKSSYFTKFYNKKSYNWQEWSKEKGPGKKHEEWTTYSLVNGFNSNDDNYIEVILYSNQK